MIKFLLNSKSVKFLAVLLAFNFLSVSLLAQGLAKVILPAGTIVRLENSSEISSENLIAGQTVDFFVSGDVKVDGKVVVKSGAIAKGYVTRVQKAKGLGKEGSLEIEIRSVQAVDGSEVKLTSSRVSEVGDDKQTAAILLGVLVCILFLTKKGENAKIPPGFSLDGRVASDTEVSL
jgi:hypothetical protein